MPYMVMERDGKHCVYKKDEDGKPMGESMGCHDSKESAMEQMAAIHANEGKMAMKPTQKEAGYVAMSTKEGKACESCRWFSGDVDMCTLIENYPEDISEKGFCERHEVSPEQHFASGGFVSGSDITFLGAAPPDLLLIPNKQLANGATVNITVTNHEHETPEVGYVAPDSNADSIFKKLGGLFQHGLKPGQSVIKGADGARYMLIVTSNSYQDRDAETMSTDALKADVNRHWTGDDTAFMSDNPLLFWHDDNLNIGDVVYGDVKGAFYLELAKEADTPLAHAIFDYRETNPDEKWGASHRFEYYRAHRSKDGTYAVIRKRETSILPREAAANALTFSGVIPMATKRDEYLNKMLGLENAAELLDKGIDALMAELDKKGIEHKSADKDAPVQEIEAAGDKYGNLLVSIIEAQAELEERLTAKETELATASKAFDDQRTADADTIKALSEQVSALKTQLDARPRSASRASETEIEKDKLSEDAKNSLPTKRNPFWNTETEGI
jgi:hypothetical protein